MTNATLFIHDLRVVSLIGTLPWEQKVHQPLIIDLAYTFDSSKAVSDDLNDVTDYRSVVDLIQSFAVENHFQLLESFTEHLATALQQTFTLSWIKLSVKKPGAIPSCSYVAAQIERSQN